MRKLREQSAAREMEKHYRKEQILEAYLNQISFGHGWYGIESAARHYFGKGAAQLTLAEAATLASLPKGPALYDPIKSPRARHRATQSRADADGAAEVHHAARRPRPRSGCRSRRCLTRDSRSTRRTSSTSCAFRRSARALPSSTGGFRVYTTLDPAAAARRESGARRRHRRRRGACRAIGTRSSRRARRASADYLQGASSRSIPAPATCARSSVGATTASRRSIASSTDCDSPARRSSRSSTRPRSRTA